MSEDGEFVVTWIDETSAAIYAQKYNNDGTTDGEQLTITNSPPDCCIILNDVDVAMDADGDFVVSWRANENYHSSGTEYTTYAQPYVNEVVGNRVEIVHGNSYSDKPQNTRIAVDDDGNLVVAWTQAGHLYVQQYNSNGDAQGGQSTIATLSNLSCDSFDDVSLDMNEDGNFVVSFLQVDYDNKTESLYLQRYRNGSFEEQKTEIDTVLSCCDNLSDVDVAMDDEGDFIVTWKHKNYYDTGDSYYYAQAYDSSGATQDNRMILDTIPCSEDLFSTAIATDENGDFVVTWAKGQYSGAGIYAQKFDVLDEELLPPVVEEEPTVIEEPEPQEQPEQDDIKISLAPSLPHNKIFAVAIKPGNFNAGKKGQTLTEQDERDRILGDKNNDTIKGNKKKDLLRGRRGNDELKAGKGNDLVKGGAGSDYLYGQAGKDKLLGGSGSDVLYGGRGKDKLIGGSDDDILIGGAGNDVLIGNRGKDAFQYNSVNEGTDKVRRFNVGQDVIDISNIFVQDYFGTGTLSYTEQFDQFITVMQMGADTHVKIDADGLGSGTTFNTLAILKKVDAGIITSESFVVEH